MRDLQGESRKVERRLWAQLAADCRRVVGFLRKKSGPVAYDEIEFLDPEPGSDFRSEMDAEFRKSGVLLACVAEGWVEVLGDTPGQPRYEFAVGTCVQLTAAGRRVQPEVGPNTGSAAITVAVRDVGKRVEVRTRGESTTLTPRSGMLLRALLAVARPCTPEDLGYPSANSLCQRAKRLREELAALPISVVILDRAITFRDGEVELRCTEVCFRESSRPSMRERTNVKGLDQGKRLGGRRRQAHTSGDE